MTILLLMTILLHLIETVRFSDKLSTMILYASQVFDTSKMFMPRRLNDCFICLGMGMGRNGNVKSHSRSSLFTNINKGLQFSRTAYKRVFIIHA